MLDDRAREREVALPRGEWIETWSGRHVRGGGEVIVDAPLERIPVWVRAGSIVVTYPAWQVAAGLGDEAERTATARRHPVGRAAAGATAARLADGGAHQLARRPLGAARRPGDQGFRAIAVSAAALCSPRAFR